MRSRSDRGRTDGTIVSVLPELVITELRSWKVEVGSVNIEPTMLTRLEFIWHVDANLHVEGMNSASTSMLACISVWRTSVEACVMKPMSQGKAIEH